MGSGNSRASPAALSAARGQGHAGAGLPKLFDSNNAAEAALTRLRSRLQWEPCGLAVVGLDCEWGRVRKGQKLKGVDLVQIAPTSQIEDSCVFHCKSGVPKPLQAFLQDPHILKVVVGATDATLLYRSGIRLQNGVDLQRVLRLLGLHEEHGLSLAEMYRSACGKEISKEQQKSNWSACKLSDAQVAYAARDAIAALEVLKALSSRHMVFDLGAAKFASIFIDSFVVDSKGNLVRDSLSKAATTCMKLEGVPKQLKAMLQRAAQKRPVCKGVSGSGVYAVAVGRKAGVYKTWAECSAQVDGFSGAKYKKFNTEVEADAFVNSGSATQ